MIKTCSSLLPHAPLPHGHYHTIIYQVVNAQNSHGMTALMLACKGGHYMCARLLLQHGADVVPRCRSGLNVLHYAALAETAGCTLVRML